MKRLTAIGLLLLLSGCVSAPTVHRDATAELIARADFKAAAQAAPAWVGAALGTITSLEAELDKTSAK